MTDQMQSSQSAPAPPHAFVQWKNTDVCFDFTCTCGVESHYDGYFAYFLRCPQCDGVWEMPWFVTPLRLVPTEQVDWTDGRIVRLIEDEDDTPAPRTP